MSKVGIVIVNYNGAKFQNDCIESFYDQTFQDFEIIVIDSGSTDNSIQMLKEKYPKVHIFEQHENVGVAKGNNIGIAISKKMGCDYTLISNNDIVMDSNMLERLVKASNNKFVTVPKIYYYEPNNLLWCAGGEFNFSKGTTTHYGMKEIDQGQYNDEKIISYAPTCSMLIPNWVFDEVGYMDDKTFMYYDDTDFCLRMYDNKIEMKYIPDAFMWHKVSSSSGGEESRTTIYYGTRNRFYFIKKHKKYMSSKTMIYAYCSNLVQYLLSPIRCKNDKYIRTAYIDFKNGNMGRKDF